MTEKDKEEIAIIVKAALRENGMCSLGIKPETAHELISFADTWKTTRKYMIGGVITVAVGGVLSALWIGVKTLLKN